MLEILRRPVPFLAKVGGAMARVLLNDTNERAVVQLTPALLSLAEPSTHKLIRQEHQNAARLADTLLHAIGGKIRRLHVVPDLKLCHAQQQSELAALVLARLLAMILRGKRQTEAQHG